MRMKKIFLVLVAVLCVATVSAQKTNWAAGLRATYGVQAVGEYFYSSDKYVEGRLGLFGGLAADFTALHQWNCCNWDWTPSVGKWYLDAGVGASLGGSRGFMYGGVTGDVKFGIKFNKVPIRLAVDVTPSFGPCFALPYTEMVEVPNTAGGVDKVKVKYGGAAGFYANGLLNLGISATYCF